MNCELCGNDHKLQGPMYWDCPPPYKVDHAKHINDYLNDESNFKVSKMNSNQAIKVLQQECQKASDISEAKILEARYLLFLIDRLNVQGLEIENCLNIIDTAHITLREAINYQKFINTHGLG